MKKNFIDKLSFLNSRYTFEELSKILNRSPKTLSDLKRGKIKNPPPELQETVDKFYLHELEVSDFDVKMRKIPETVIFNYGGGRQTVAMCVMIAKGVLPKPDIIVIADTGRENPMTWEYLEKYVNPLLKSVDLTVEIAPRSLSKTDLYSKKGALLIPAFTETGKLKSFCSSEWKKLVVERYLSSKGITGGENWLGFAFDEKKRWKVRHNTFHRRWYTVCPLVNLRFDTDLCMATIKAAGLPLPHRSSCWMCPHKQNSEWLAIKENYPEKWAEAIALDKELRDSDDVSKLYLHHSRVSLEDAELDFSEENETIRQCDLGTCFI